MAEQNYEASLENPVELTIENKTGITQTFRYYLCNFVDTLQPNDAVKLLVTSSEALAFYTKLKEELAQANTSSAPTPMDFAKAMWETSTKRIESIEQTSETEDGTQYEVKVDNGEVIESASMTIFKEEKYINPEELDDGEGGNYIAEGILHSTHYTYVNTAGVVIGHNHIEI